MRRLARTFASTGALAHALAAAIAPIAGAAAAVGCSAVGTVAGGTASCDRRTVASAPKPYCQEIVDTVAVPQFRADCQDHLHGAYAETTCPRAKAIGGCEIGGSNEDGSKIVDWFYDVSADPNLSRYPAADIARSISDVRRFCADSTRYDRGARLVAP